MQSSVDCVLEQARQGENKSLTTAQIIFAAIAAKSSLNASFAPAAAGIMTAI
jgi:hypothetical protein